MCLCHEYVVCVAAWVLSVLSCKSNGDNEMTALFRTQTWGVGTVKCGTCISWCSVDMHTRAHCHWNLLLMNSSLLYLIETAVQNWELSNTNPVDFPSHLLENINEIKYNIWITVWWNAYRISSINKPHKLV
jgi:hypothetical protein